MCKTQVKEINPTDVIKGLESNFTDYTADDNPFSREDRYKAEGRQSLWTSNPFQDGQTCAVHRLTPLEQQLRRSEQYYKDYVHFMNDIITQGDAEKVPWPELDNQPAWYILHYGVYHPHKLRKICVVWLFSTLPRNLSKRSPLDWARPD